MLQAIRSRAASWVVKILFVLLILSFGVWGIADWLRQVQGPGSVATIGSATIEPQQFGQAMNDAMQRLRQSFGRAIDRNQARQLGLVDQTLEDLVSRSLIAQEAQRVGIMIADDTVRDAIRGDRSFVDATGMFDRNRFELLLQRAGYTEARFVDSMRSDLTRQQLLRPLAAGIAPTDGLVDALFRYRREHRLAMVATIPASAVPPPAAPSEAQLADYHKANPQAFTAPERRQISFVTLDATVLARAITPTDAQIREAYDSRLAQLSAPEKRVVEQALYPDEAAAQAARAKIDAGGDFLAVAQETAKQSTEQTQIGAVGAAELPPELSQPVFGAETGKPIGPIHSPFGWHLIRVTEIQPAHTPGFDEVKAQITQDLQREKSADALYEASNKLEDALAANTSLEDIAKQLDLQVVTLNDLDNTGRAPDGTRPAPLPQGDALLQAAFGLTAAGQSSRMVELSADSYGAVRVDAIAPAALRPLDQVRDAVATAWSEAQRAAGAHGLGETALAALKSGTAFDKALPAGAGAPDTTAPFTREGEGASLPPEMVAQLFDGPIGTVAMADLPTGGTLVARLTAIQAADPKADAAALERIRSEQRNALTEDVLLAYQTALRQRFPVSIDRRAVEAAF